MPRRRVLRGNKASARGPASVLLLRPWSPTCRSRHSAETPTTPWFARRGMASSEKMCTGGRRMGSRTSSFAYAASRVLDPVLERGSSAPLSVRLTAREDPGFALLRSLGKESDLIPLFREQCRNWFCRKIAMGDFGGKSSPFGGEARRRLRHGCQNDAKEHCVLGCPIRMLPLFC